MLQVSLGLCRAPGVPTAAEVRWVFPDCNICFLPAGVGDFSVWEFSGNPVYFCCYDYFAANDPTSIHVIVFSLEEPYEIQLNQVIFWLSFLKSLVPVEEPIGERGPSFLAPEILLLGSSCWPHSDPTGRHSQLWLPPNPEAFLIATSLLCCTSSPRPSLLSAQWSPPPTAPAPFWKVPEQSSAGGVILQSAAPCSPAEKTQVVWPQHTG